MRLGGAAVLLFCCVAVLPFNKSILVNRNGQLQKRDGLAEVILVPGID
jgi:hypothetical protein